MFCTLSRGLDQIICLRIYGYTYKYVVLSAEYRHSKKPQTDLKSSTKNLQSIFYDRNVYLDNNGF